MRIPLHPIAKHLLTNRSFDMEFAGFFTNHAKHAVIALQGLEAEPSRIQEYWDWYTADMPREQPLGKVSQDWTQVQRIDKNEWLSLRGKKTKWQEQVAFMDAELERLGSTDRLVAEYVDVTMIDGVAGSLAHGIIHLGYAIDSGSPTMISEGLAYLNYCHLSVNPSKFQPQAHADATPTDSWLRVAETFYEQDLANTWVKPTKAKYDESFHPELVVAGLQWQASKLLHDPHELAIELPSWVDADDAAATWKALYEGAISLYLASRDIDGFGNFVVLHLLSSLWALEQTCRIVEKETAAEHAAAVRRRAWSQYYTTAVVFMSSVNGVPTVEKLRSIQQEFPLDATDEESLDWTPMVEAGKAEEEEHNIKLVYVTRELWNRYGHWKGYSAAARTFTSP